MLSFLGLNIFLDTLEDLEYIQPFSQTIPEV